VRAVFFFRLGIFTYFLFFIERLRVFDQGEGFLSIRKTRQGKMVSLIFTRFTVTVNKMGLLIWV